MKGILILGIIVTGIFLIDFILDITGIVKNLPKDGGFN